MNINKYWREKLACAYFFACPGIAYGIFTSRLPSLKAMTDANDAQIGLMLFAFGMAGFCGLTGSKYLIEHLSAKWVIGASSLLIAIAFIIAGLAINYWQLLGFGMVGGVATGLCDVAMNAQGIIIEKKYHKRSLSFFHATFSFGGVCGSLTGSAFAALSLSPFINFLAIMGLYLGLWPFAIRNIIEEKSSGGSKARQKTSSKLPAIIYILGLMSLGCYVSEGSIAEWGSILLHSIKGASQEQAALVFACFSTTMVIGRFMGDGIRAHFSDFSIVLAGSLIGCIGMAIILLTPSPLICLISYACMGFGFAPIVPILFSRAGSAPGVSPEQASSLVSLMAYSGLLVFPPFIGLLAQWFGLDKALWLIVLVICGIVYGSFRLYQTRDIAEK